MPRLETPKTKESLTEIVTIHSPIQLMEALDIYKQYMKEQNQTVDDKIRLNYLSILSGSEKLLGAVRSGKVVGTISTQYLGNGKTQIKKFFILKAFRGQKIGSELFSHACSQAVSNNNETAQTSIVLATCSNWKQAVKFYEQVGMTEISKEELGFDPHVRNDKFYKMLI